MSRARACEVQYSIPLENPPEKSTSSIIVTKTSPAETTIVYDTFWRFAAERQRIFRARARAEKPPWTTDTILKKFKFTNAYRAADRTSQFLIRRVIHEGPQTPEDIFFRVILFKLFNKIETWRMLETEIGPICWESYSFDQYDRVLNEAFLRGVTIYSGAYIIPSPRGYGHTRKHRNHLALLESLIQDQYPKKIQDSSRMRDAFDLLRGVSSFGDFLAYQYVTDLNYSSLTDFSEREFVVPGPGALSGLRKCFRHGGGLGAGDLIRMVHDRQAEEFGDRGMAFEDLWGRPLQLIDIQNLFCEVDKYSRVAHPEFTESGGRSRIKQMFRQSSGKCRRPWFPPTWGLNDCIAEELDNVDI